MHIDWDIFAFFVLTAFVLLGAILAYWHVLVTHHERNRQYNPQEARLFDLMRAQEHVSAKRVKRTLGTRAVLPQDWKETG